MINTLFSAAMWAFDELADSTGTGVARHGLPPLVRRQGGSVAGQSVWEEVHGGDDLIGG